MEQRNRPERLWSIVLAGGDGLRMKGFIRHRLGHEVPKQYCAFTAKRSMFQDTLDRAATLTPWQRLVVAACRYHQALGNSIYRWRAL